ncbi:MAG: hypothetical protein RMK52_03605 [Chitinophagales bacterium]|nr:hypothetical protein [Chitinophagales bacterium]MDW8393313.1 hypothetical protein [Chitinophagales bacterium]
MKRRTFIRKAGMAAAGALTLPYILPSGRLFAGSGNRLVNHVVFMLFAGGVRHQESIDQGYLLAQGLPSTGNVMRNMLAGPPPASNLVYTPWNPILSTPLTAKGTLFKELRYSSGPTGHFNGHTAAMTGHYTEASLNLNINPEFPTVFEYYRKHSDPARSAINCWWISEGLGPYPALNFSRHPDYGPLYGANYLRPISTFGTHGLDYLSAPKSFQPDDVQRIAVMKEFLDANFPKSGAEYAGISNNPDDQQLIKDFIQTTLNKTADGLIEWPLPPGISPAELTGDLITIAYGWEVLKQLRPELLVINSFDLDACHFNFTDYLTFMHKADYGVGWLWNKIQSDPILKDDTIMICMPDHGRNEKPNTVYDQNGLAAFDHTSDDNSRRHFALIVGPPGKVRQGQVVGGAGNPVGETIDAVPTIAHILGFADSIPAGLLPGRVWHEAFY